MQTVRTATEDASFFKNITSKAYYKLINSMSKVEITPGGSDFRLMDKVAVEAFRRYRERARFIRGLVNTLGFKVATFEFTAPPRFAGHSKYNLRKMLHFAALDGITSFSNLPLRWAFYIGIVFGLISFLLVLHVLYVKYVANDAVPGWATMTASVLFLGGIQLVGIGILGEYIGRIFEEVKAKTTVYSGQTHRQTVVLVYNRLNLWYNLVVYKRRKEVMWVVKRGLICLVFTCVLCLANMTTALAAFEYGDNGPEVLAIQKRLVELKYEIKLLD